MTKKELLEVLSTVSTTAKIIAEDETGLIELSSARLVGNVVLVRLGSFTTLKAAENQ